MSFPYRHFGQMCSLAMLDKYNLSAHISNGEVVIGTDSDLDVFLSGNKNNDGLYEIMRSTDRASDPKSIQKVVKN
jgi:hypothetical protein